MAERGGQDRRRRQAGRRDGSRPGGGGGGRGDGGGSGPGAVEAARATALAASGAVERGGRGLERWRRHEGRRRAAALAESGAAAARSGDGGLAVSRAGERGWPRREGLRPSGGGGGEQAPDPASPGGCAIGNATTAASPWMGSAGL